MKMRRFKNFSSGLISLMVVYFIFCTMNELVAQLIFFFGLSVIGVYIFRLNHLIINKLKDIQLCDCGFWNKDGIYNYDIKLVDLGKESYTRDKICKEFYNLEKFEDTEKNKNISDNIN